MAQQTTNYDLTKPDSNEYVDVAVLNENFDKIDKAIAEAKYIVAATGERYKWGMDATGLFLEEV
jgi:hypothetical protein